MPTLEGFPSWMYEEGASASLLRTDLMQALNCEAQGRTWGLSWAPWCSSPGPDSTWDAGSSSPSPSLQPHSYPKSLWESWSSLCRRSWWEAVKSTHSNTPRPKLLDSGKSWIWNGLRGCTLAASSSITPSLQDRFIHSYKCAGIICRCRA